MHLALTACLHAHSCPYVHTLTYRTSNGVRQQGLDHLWAVFGIGVMIYAAAAAAAAEAAAEEEQEELYDPDNAACGAPDRSRPLQDTSPNVLLLLMAGSVLCF